MTADFLATATHAEYDRRGEAVYWNPATPACRAKATGHRECLLPPDHPGDHYGNGFDAYGPKGPSRWQRSTNDGHAHTPRCATCGVPL